MERLSTSMEKAIRILAEQKKLSPMEEELLGEVDALRAALEQIAADGCDCLDRDEGGPWLCHGCIAKRVL